MNFYSPLNYQKSYNFLITDSFKGKWKLINNSLVIKSKIWRRSGTDALIKAKGPVA